MNKKKILGGLVAAAVVAGGAVLWQTTAGAETGNSTANGYAACIASGNKLKNDQIFPISRTPVCASNETLYTWPSQKAAAAAQLQINGLLTSVSSLNETASDLQDQIDALDGGKQNVPAPVSASTSVSGWSETSGWANDTFTRTVTVKRGATAPSSKCDGAATCWEYTGTLVDTGSFLTVIGAHSPQAGTPIAQQVSGSMTGGATLHLYSSSNAPDPSLVPATQSGRAASGALSGTTSWVQQLFPAGTTFTPNLVSYKWVYNAPATCETWTDAINPGDDGHSPADGDITGVVQAGCVS